MRAPRLRIPASKARIARWMVGETSLSPMIAELRGLCAERRMVEPAGRPECQATEGRPVCYPPESALSLRFVLTGPIVVLGALYGHRFWCERMNLKSARQGVPVPTGSSNISPHCGEDVDCIPLGVCAPRGWVQLRPTSLPHDAGSTRLFRA